MGTSATMLGILVATATAAATPGEPRGAPEEGPVGTATRTADAPGVGRARTATEAPARASIVGRVLERGTRIPLADATVTVGGTSTVADAKGRFELRELDPGEVALVVEVYEHEPETVRVALAPGERRELHIDLLRLRAVPYRILVVGKARTGAPTTFDFDLGETTVLPGTLGDGLKAVQNAPGAARTPLGLGGLVIRGSAPKDTLVALDGHELPMLYHFAGLSSVVNADTLARLDFAPGNFGARYGRATGGLVELESRAGKAAPHGYLDIDLIDVTFLAEASVFDGGLLVSGRRSWLDTFFTLTFAGLGDDLKVAPRTYDYQARYERALFGGRASFSVLGADDRFEYVVGDKANLDRPTLDLHTGFHLFRGSWVRDVSDDVRARLSGTLGYHVDATSVGDALADDRRALDGTVRAELRYRALREVLLEGGLDLRARRYDLRRVGPPPLGPDTLVVRPNPLPDFENALSFGDGGGSTGNVEARAAGVEVSPALWLETSLELGPLRVVPGLRFDHHDLAGANTLEPRLAAYAPLGADTVVKGGIGLYSKPPDPELLTPVFGSPSLPPERALHASLGVEQVLPWSLRLSGEVYWKTMWNLAVAAARAGADGPSYTGTGEGRAQGLELLLRRRQAVGLSGWLSYALSRSERQRREDRPAALFAYDQTHVLTLVASYRTAQDWTFGLRLRYATGNPVTPVAGRVFLADSGAYAPIWADTPSERLPDFFELDLRLDKEWVFRDVIANAYVDVQNATNRQNAEGYQYSFDYTERRPFRGLPILPTAGVRLRF